MLGKDVTWSNLHFHKGLLSSVHRLDGSKVRVKKTEEAIVNCLPRETCSPSHSSCFLYCDLLYLIIKKWGLFPHSLDLYWSCDLLSLMDCSRRLQFSQTQVSRDLDVFLDTNAYECTWVDLLEQKSQMNYRASAPAEASQSPAKPNSILQTQDGVEQRQKRQKNCT